MQQIAHGIRTRGSMVSEASHTVWRMTANDAQHSTAFNCNMRPPVVCGGKPQSTHAPLLLYAAGRRLYNSYGTMQRPPPEAMCLCTFAGTR